MSTTIDVEVMYSESLRGNTYKRKRVGLMAAPSLERNNVLAIILSDTTTSARSRRTFNGNPVERRGNVFLWDNGTRERALLIVRGGEVMLGPWLGATSWYWTRVDDSTLSRISGIPVDMPKDALVFYPPTVVGVGMKPKAISESELDMF